jgi:hypothetical protein
MKPYVFGDVVTPAEVKQIRARLLPEYKSARLKKLGATAFVQAIHEVIPQRLEHEVNRLRGLAFDSGEAGFSHTTGTTA